MSTAQSLGRRAVAELVGTALLLAVVVGSGIMAQRLFPESVGLALLANALATGGGLIALILTFGPVSGANFNPVVTLYDVARRARPARELGPYVGAQVAGAIVGVWVAHVVFALPVFEVSHHVRSGLPLMASEVLATFGLLVVIAGVAAHRGEAVPYAVGGYILAAYWFTPSTSFANPAVTVARALTDTFAGIRPADAPGFILAQLAGTALAAALHRFLHPRP
jgi:glycerol uptake facilitator-like aquaporin